MSGTWDWPSAASRSSKWGRPSSSVVCHACAQADDTIRSSAPRFSPAYREDGSTAGATWLRASAAAAAVSRPEQRVTRAEDQDRVGYGSIRAAGEVVQNGVDPPPARRFRRRQREDCPATQPAVHLARPAAAALG